jgi:hypothetical protein
MHPKTEKLVEGIRNKANDARASLEEAKQQFGSNDDSHLLGEIKRAGYWLDDIETYFVRQLEKDTDPPRSLADELHMISDAEMHLNMRALPLVKKICEWAKTYGPRFKTAGG